MSYPGDPTGTDKITSRERKVIAKVRAALGDLVASISDEDVLRAIRSRSVDNITRALPLVEMTTAVRAIAQDSLDEIAAAGRSVAISGFKFDDHDTRAVQWANKRAGTLARDLSAEQVTIVRQVIASAIQDGFTVTDTAKRLADTLGLQPRSTTGIIKAHDRAYERARARGLSEQRAKEAADRASLTMRRRLVTSRARTIARTEILTASNQGRLEGWRQQVEAGVIDRRAEKEWLVSRPCPICAPYAGQVVRWNETFTNGLLMPPLHPNCRCTAVIVS